jgi:hypothetical protein
VIAKLLWGLGALGVASSFLVMCLRELVWLLAPAATPTILISLCLLDLVVNCVSAVAHSNRVVVLHLLHF